MKNDDLTPEEKAHVVRAVEKIATELLSSRLLAQLTNEPISTLAPSPRTPADLVDDLREMFAEGRIEEFNETPLGLRYKTVSFTYRTVDPRSTR